ncbi:hypothetical protein Pfo_027494 [Paulownia fortunei]|nr:hypothetical protein Pfo_027494 [Paulownia fortunei]
MRERKSRNNGEQKPTNTLRRSPRFLQENQTGVENPGTPKPAARKISTPDSFSTSLGSSITKTQKNGGGVSQTGGRKGTESRILTKYGKGSRRSARLDCRANLSSLDLQKQYVTEKRVTRSSVCASRFVYSQDNECDEISGKGDRKVTELKSSKKSGKGSSRSGRLDGGANVSKYEEVLDSQKQYVIEKRVTRSSVRSEEGKAKVSVDFCEQSIGNIEKRVTRSSSQTKTIQSVEKASNVSTDSPHKGVMPDERKPKGDGELSKPYISKRDVNGCGIKSGSGDKNCKRKMRIGEKRKRYQVEEECEVVQGWTKEQELALQRAYFTAKPTPHFWKKVARMVPGKSAEECFDRIHSDHLTPSQPQPRSRAKRKEPSPLSFSASKLLSPAEMKTKKLRSRRRTLLAQKTVRQLLQKQHNENQDYKADLFAVLEPTIEPSSLNFQEGTAFASPAPNRGSVILTRCREMSSSAHKKHLSRLNSSHKADFVSPPVLKQVKNKALHEKYIDQLHCRDAKRKSESLRNAKCIQDKNDKKATDLKVNSVKVAKDALVFDAQDAINQFRSLQSGTNYNIDDDDNTSRNDEDEDEDELC